MRQEVFELYELLETARVSGPLVLVGQSIGGLLVRLYTEQYGSNVVGVVLVDPTHESSMLGSVRYGGWVRLREKALGEQFRRPGCEEATNSPPIPPPITWPRSFRRSTSRGRQILNPSVITR